MRYNVNRLFVIMVSMILKIFNVKDALDKAKDKNKHLSKDTMSKVSKT